ncbi:MAG: hypothetical protein H0U32_00895 [Thermoleophilaceae bacterium]|nr:hypothetical protein [Thermoleophilaceae bacterium]
MPAKIVFVGGESVNVEQDVDEARIAIQADEFAGFDLRSDVKRRVYVRREAVAYIEQPADTELPTF